MTSSFQYFIKAAIQNEEQRIIEGFATVEVVDRDGEIIDVQSVAQAFKTYMKNPVLLLHHDLSRPIGKVLEYKLTTKDGARAIWIRAQIAKDTTEANETWALIKQGVLKAFSIRGKTGYVRTKNGTRVVKVSDLMEISLVSVPANQESLIEVVSKSLKQGKEGERLTEEVIDVKEEVKKAIHELKKDIVKHIDDVINEKFNPVLETVKTLNETVKAIKPEEQKQEPNSDEIKKAIAEEVKKAVEENTQILILKKALGVAKQEDETHEEVDLDDGPVDLVKFAKLVKEAK